MPRASLMEKAGSAWLHPFEKVRCAREFAQKELGRVCREREKRRAGAASVRASYSMDWLGMPKRG